ncbi:MAG: polysaccharide deacetylase [Clostridia bacterium]|jgi:probable sporulation protein (polysaccharide deacetylase family)|nr:polysaccharide deacetylase [Clostridia bacterium]
MKTRIIILSRKKLILTLILVLLIAAFLLTLNEISVNTMNYYDPIYKGEADEKEVAFACNVVWGNEYLPDMLRIFKENDIEITFFIGGEWADKYPDELKTIFNEGHELGNHGYGHKKQSQLNIEQNKQEILKAEEAIKKVTGVKTSLFAPPYGDVNETVTNSAEALGYKVIMWSIDTIDWNTKDYNMILDRVEKKQHNGAIILMHPTEVTVKALPDMIKRLKDKGYEVESVSEVLE